MVAPAGTGGVDARRAGSTVIRDAATEVLAFVGTMVLGGLAGATLTAALPDLVAAGGARWGIVLAAAGPLLASLGWAVMRPLPSGLVAELAIAQAAVVVGLWLAGWTGFVTTEAAVRWVQPSLVLMVASRVAVRALDIGNPTARPGRVRSPGRRHQSMRKLISSLSLTIAIALAAAAPASATEIPESGRMFAQDHIVPAAQAQLLGKEMHPGMHRGYSVFVPNR